MSVKEIFQLIASDVTTMKITKEMHGKILKYFMIYKNISVSPRSLNRWALPWTWFSRWYCRQQKKCIAFSCPFKKKSLWPFKFLKWTQSRIVIKRNQNPIWPGIFKPGSIWSHGYSMNFNEVVVTQIGGRQIPIYRGKKIKLH